MAKTFKVVKTAQELAVTYDTRHRIGSGLTAQQAWQNPNVMRAMRDLFGCQPHEEIVGVEVNEIGILVRMEHK